MLLEEKKRKEKKLKGIYSRQNKLFKSECELHLLSTFSVGDRCREENEYPYFLSMLSERYGYVMDPEGVPSDIKARSVKAADKQSYVH